MSESCLFIGVNINRVNSARVDKEDFSLISPNARELRRKLINVLSRVDLISKIIVTANAFDYTDRIAENILILYLNVYFSRMKNLRRLFISVILFA